MIPKRVTLENFLSFGSPKAEIEFGDDEPLWVVGGPNGVGKSAVFDAITFCLYGSHRGDGKEVAPLTRHGADGFTVGVEFEFNGAAYKIVRGRTRTGPVQSVHRKVGDDWERLPDLANGRDVNAWTERTLGIGPDAFEASVLLRQGQADKVVAAKPKQRLEFLKCVLGMGGYEELSGRVHKAKMATDARRQGLVDQRNNLADASDDDVRAAAGADAAAAAGRAEAEAAVGVAGERVRQARRHEEITRETGELAAKFAAAAERAADADAIRRDHARLGELAGVLPALGMLVPIRDRLPAIERDHAEVAGRLAEAAAARDEAARDAEAQRLAVARHRQQAADLAAQIGELRAAAAALEQEVAKAKELAGLDARLAEFGADLDDRAAHSADVVRQAADADRAAGQERSASHALLKQRTEERAELAAVEAGRCSRCGQPVGPEHLALERHRLDDLIADLSAKTKAADDAGRRAKAAFDKAADAERAITARVRERDRLAADRAARAALGVSADATGLCAKLRELAEAVADREQTQAAERERQAAAEAAGKRADAAFTHRKAQAEQLSKREADLDRALAADRGKADAFLAALPAGWAAATADDLDRWAAERAGLDAAGVADRHAALQQDFAQTDVWTERRAELERQTESIPPEGRCPVADAEGRHAGAVAAFRAADARSQQCRTDHADLARRAEQRKKLVADLADAERVARVHKRLDDLLGNAGLQRELVRRAETAIVRYAHETAGKLSDGELAVSLAEASDGDKALDLLVRVGDDPVPTPVAYLSGSQRFRVAVAVALGIGRFATRGAKPIESVIIDEGFGSLDKDGLRAAAEELTRLRGTLKRIILVSHQEEFADRFPAVIQLARGETGTTATAVRR